MKKIMFIMLLLVLVFNCSPKEKFELEDSKVINAYAKVYEDEEYMGTAGFGDFAIEIYDDIKIKEYYIDVEDSLLNSRFIEYDDGIKDTLYFKCVAWRTMLYKSVIIEREGKKVNKNKLQDIELGFRKFQPGGSLFFRKGPVKASKYDSIISIEEIFKRK